LVTSKLLPLKLISEQVGWEAEVAGWAARADMRVYERGMTDMSERPVTPEQLS